MLNRESVFRTLQNVAPKPCKCSSGAHGCKLRQPCKNPMMICQSYDESCDKAILWQNLGSFIGWFDANIWFGSFGYDFVILEHHADSLLCLNTHDKWLSFKSNENFMDYRHVNVLATKNCFDWRLKRPNLLKWDSTDWITQLMFSCATFSMMKQPHVQMKTTQNLLMWIELTNQRNQRLKLVQTTCLKNLLRPINNYLVLATIAK